MIRSTRILSTGLLLCVISGCAMIPPDPVVTGPLTAPPPERTSVSPSEPNGSIFQPTAYGNFPLFEDRRPRNVGDIVTVLIEEKTNAAKNVQTSTDRDSSASFGASLLPKWIPNEAGSKAELEASGNNAMTGKGSSKADNSFKSTITTTVVGVLPNGNLQIAGNKEIAINRGSEYVRFSGVVDPRSITGANTVISTQVADAKIEYRSRGTMDEVQTMGWLQRFFLNVSPF